MSLSPQQRMWTIGDYPAIARLLQPVSADLVERVGISAGQTVLDIGVGDGNTAILSARRGAITTGVDVTPAQIERARQRTAAEGVSVDLRVGDAEQLDLPDAAFDAVVSVFGVIFAPDHARATAELARVCRPGGTVAITAWVAGGWSAQWRQRTAHLVPPPPPGPTPEDWADPGEARRRFAAAGLGAHVRECPFAWRFPSPAACIDFFLANAGPMMTYFETLRDAGHEVEGRELFEAALIDENVADDGSLELPAPYVIISNRPL